MSIKIEKDFLVSSDENKGAYNKTEDGSTFTINQNLSIPADARNIKIEISKMLVWNNFFNIKEGENNKFYIYGPKTNDEYQLFEISIYSGIYDLNTLLNDILLELQLQDAKQEPQAIFSMEPDTATGKINFILNYDNMYIEMRSWNTFHKILGLEEKQYTIPQNKTSPYQFLGDNGFAQFNSIEYILLHSNITDKGLELNGQTYNIIGQILPDVKSGSLIIYQPITPLKIECDNLKGNTINNITFWITDQDNNLLDTNKENYSMLLKLTYEKNLVYGID